MKKDKIFQLQAKKFFNLFNGLEKNTNQGVNTLISLIHKQIAQESENDISLDHEAILSIHKNTHKIYITSLETNNINDGLQYIADNIFLNNKSSKKDKGITIHIQTNNEYNLIDISNAMQIIYEVGDKELEFAFSISCDNRFSKNYFKIITIVSFGMDMTKRDYD